jgi:hypothetical protein
MRKTVFLFGKHGLLFLHTFLAKSKTILGNYKTNKPMTLKEQRKLNKITVKIQKQIDKLEDIYTDIQDHLCELDSQIAAQPKPNNQ